MRQTGASDEKVEQAARYLRHDYGYAAVGAYQVVADVLGIAVSPDERIIALDDLKRLRRIAMESELMPEDRVFVKNTVDPLIAGGDAP